jgi:hypothetical protein
MEEPAGARIGEGVRQRVDDQQAQHTCPTAPQASPGRVGAAVAASSAARSTFSLVAGDTNDGRE